MGKLTAHEIKAYLAKGSGRYHAGMGYFARHRDWSRPMEAVCIQHDGKRRDIGLGSSKLVTLAGARAKAAEARKAIREDERDLSRKA